MIWTEERKKQLETLGFSYDEGNNIFTKSLPDHNEYVKATSEFLYWFRMKEDVGSSKFPFYDFEALVTFLKSIDSIRRENEI